MTFPEFTLFYSDGCKSGRGLVNWDVLRSGAIHQESENLSKSNLEHFKSASFL